MKIRTDYVSNSSSSSFVLSNMFAFDFFDITKEDILNALIDAYGVEAYKNEKMSRLKCVKDLPEFYKEDMKYGNFGPFWVYDLSIPEERKEAIERWKDTLKYWNATNCKKVVDRKGKRRIMLDGDACRIYDNAIDGIAEIYDISKYCLDEVAAGGSAKNCKRFVPSENKDPKSGMYGHYEPISKELVAMVRDIRKTAGVMTNLDVIRSKMSRFFVHADDNELVVVDADEYEPEHKGKRQTEEYTYDRVCEMLLDYFVKIGKVKLDDPKFLEEMKVDDKYLTDKDKEKGLIYTFYDRKRFSWKDLKWHSMTWNLHEG